MSEAGAGPRAGGDSSSRVRDQLANERTFLAWVRTALGLVGLGFVLARMGLFLRQLAVVGAVVSPRELRASHEFLVTGVVFLVLGSALSAWTGRLYVLRRRAIDEGRYETAGGTALALTLIVVVGGLILAGLVLWHTLAADHPTS